MKNETLYNKTVDILVQAFFDDSLVHGNCYACAVGNIINHYKKFTSQERNELTYHDDGWVRVFCTINNNGQQIKKEEYKGKAKEQIDRTGYSYLELAKIEYAFETADQGNSNDEWMFNGLMAVIEVLDQIHENTDHEVTKSSKQKFVKAEL